MEEEQNKWCPTATIDIELSEKVKIKKKKLNIEENYVVQMEKKNLSIEENDEIVTIKYINV
mgnify:CR=1 FL=1